MTYLPRFSEQKIYQLTRQFGAILVTGPRQAGKTTLLTHAARQLFKSNFSTFSFDTPSEMDAFRRDPDLFFLNHPGILLLNEVQHVPDIFPYLKREIDKHPNKFRFFITGSQHFSLMRGVSESLAGRAAILDLWPLAQQEISKSNLKHTLHFLEDPSALHTLRQKEFPANDKQHVVPCMLRGGYPSVALTNPSTDWFESYRRTYLQRDIRELSQVGDLGRFDRFLTLCAGRSGTILNKAEFSRSLSIDNKTVDHWLSLLETSYQMISLPAYHAHTTKRITKRPKWIFADSGLGLHLQGIRDMPGLLSAPHFGHLFEAFVIMEIRKLFGHVGKPWNAFHFRDAAGLECDLVLAKGGLLLPIEIKHTARPSTSDLAPLRRFMELYPKVTPYGLVISLNPKVEQLSPNIFNLPLGLILTGA
jgi:uncharacterized protein